MVRIAVNGLFLKKDDTWHTSCDTDIEVPGYLCGTCSLGSFCGREVSFLCGCLYGLHQGHFRRARGVDALDLAGRLQ